MSYQITHKKYLSESELIYLKSMLAKHSSRDTCLIELILATGSRASEALNIEFSDLDQASCTVFIKGLKGSLNRTIPISKNLMARLLGLKNSTPKLFNISYRRLSQIWDAYKPTNKGLHCLRHTFAINLYKKTKDIRLVQSALGHKSINNTMVYMTLVNTTDELRKALAV